MSNSETESQKAERKKEADEYKFRKDKQNKLEDDFKSLMERNTFG